MITKVRFAENPVTGGVAESTSAEEYGRGVCKLYGCRTIEQESRSCPWAKVLGGGVLLASVPRLYILTAELKPCSSDMRTAAHALYAGLHMVAARRNWYRCSICKFLELQPAGQPQHQRFGVEKGKAAQAAISGCILRPNCLDAPLFKSRRWPACHLYLFPPEEGSGTARTGYSGSLQAHAQE